MYKEKASKWLTVAPEGIIGLKNPMACPIIHEKPIVGDAINHEKDLRRP